MTDMSDADFKKLSLATRKKYAGAIEELASPSIYEMSTAERKKRMRKAKKALKKKGMVFVTLNELLK